MGARATITIRQEYSETPINLYTHWTGAEICETLAEGLKRAKDAGRLDDSAYATRIIFDTLTGLEGGSTGFGIIIGDHDDINYTSPTVWWKSSQSPMVFYGELEMTADAFITLFAPDKSEGVAVVV